MFLLSDYHVCYLFENSTLNGKMVAIEPVNHVQRPSQYSQ